MKDTALVKGYQFDVPWCYVLYPRKVENEQHVKMRNKGSFRAVLSKSARRLRLLDSMEEPLRRAGMESSAAASATKPIARMAQGKPDDLVRRSNMMM